MATGQSIKYKPAWLVEAIHELGPFVTQFTKEFMRRHNLPILKKKTDMLNRIQDEIIKGRLRFADLVEYVDELKMWGRQNVVLYALNDEQGEYLKKLRDPNHIKGKLAELRLKNRYNKNICRWESETPFLSEVRHRFDTKEKQGALSFKWVQTRHFEKEQFVKGVGKVIMEFDERSANFFIINLADGTAQLRIQRLPPNSLTKLEEEIKRYAGEIGNLLGLEHFTPLPLKSVMKEFLFKKVLTIPSWIVRTQRGRLQGDREDPSFIQRRFRLPFQHVTPREVNLYWECQQEVGNINRGRLYFALEAEDGTDVIAFNAMTDRTKVDYLVSIILEAAMKYSKIKSPVIDVELPPPPKIPEEGVVDVFEGESPGKQPGRTRKVFARTAILPSLALVRVLFSIILPWVAEEFVEGLTNAPFIVFELVAYGVLLFFFYGNKRVKKYLFRIPPKYTNIGIKMFLGESADLIIGSKEYDEWLKAQTVSSKSSTPSTPSSTLGALSPGKP